MSKAPYCENEEVVLGIDAGMSQHTVTIRAKDERVKTIHMPATEAALDGLVERLPGCQIRALYEAGADGFNLCRQLARRSIECKVVAPSLVPIEQGMRRRKNDRRDSKRLAELNNSLRSIGIPTEQQEAHRQLLRVREALVKHRAALQLQIHSLLRFAGHPLSICEEDTGTKWGPKRIRILERMKLDYPERTQALQLLVQALCGVRRNVLDAEREIGKLAGSDAYRELMSRFLKIKGIGVVSAMTFIVEIFDPHRFPSAEKVGAYLGFVPQEDTTGGEVKLGGILATGNKHVRRIMVQCAWKWLYGDSYPQEFARRFYHNHGNQKGVKQKLAVALARKLAITLWAMWRDGTEYKHLPPPVPPSKEDPGPQQANAKNEQKDVA